MAPNKSRSWLSRLESTEDCAKAMKEASNGFLVVAAIQGAGALLLRQYANLFDVAVMLAGAYLVRRFQSRAAAVVLLVLSLADLGVTISNKLGATSSGGGNIILAVIMVVAGVRAVQATFKHRKLAQAPANALVRT